MENIDIILVGCGPTSAVLASLLAQYGWNIAIFERNLEIYDLPRAVFFDDEVMRIFQQIGLSDEIVTLTNKVQGMQLLNAKDEMLAEYIAEDAPEPSGWHAGYMFHQPTLEKTLRDGMKRHPNISLHLGAEVTKISQSKQLVTIEVETKEGLSTYSAKYLVGCCGARSITRSVIETGVQDFHADQDWIVIDIELLKYIELPQYTVQYCDPGRPSTFIPTPGLFRRFELMLMPDESADEMLHPNKISELLSKWLKPEDYRITRSTVYQFHALIAEKWRSGSVFIAGDAAHQMPPFLGQGMCSGIKDAANLAWKLDAVLKGIASPNLLDTYEAERRPFVEEVIRADLWLSDMIQTTSAAIANERDAQLLNAPPSAKKLNPPKIKLGGSYCQKNELSAAPFIQPLMTDGVLHDIHLGNHFALIGDIPISNLSEDLINKFAIKKITDPVPEISNWLIKNNAKAVLVRPDKYVQAVLTADSNLEEILQSLEQ